ncbi:DUF6268 family outer membrane beta-barrel protein [Mucilaginibacter sp. AW1-3]
MRLVKPLLLAITFCYCSFAKAQNDDKLSYDFSYGKTAASKGGGTFISNSVKLLFPVKPGFSIGPELSLVNITDTHSLLDSASYKTIGLSLGYHTKLGEKTIMSIHAEPLLASDLDDISAEDWRFRSEVLFLFPTSKKFALGFGLGYQYQFSGSQLLPIITMIWHINDNITVNGPLPLAPRLDFKLTDKWTLGAGFKSDYGSYRLSAAKYQSRYAQYRNSNIGINLQYKPVGKLTLGGFLGIGSRKIDIYKKDQTVPLRIYGWNIGGGSYTPYFTQKYSGLALNCSLVYKL